MNRRLFINRVSAGCVLPFLSFSAFGQDNTQDKAILDTHAFAQLATDIRQGVIGAVQQLTITRVYSPERTSLQTLQTVSQQDIDLLSQGLGLDLAIDARRISTAIASAAFGSYSVKFAHGPIQVVWQCLPRLGMELNDMTGSLSIAGSQGVLQTSLDSLSYAIVDLQGRIVQANRLTTIV